MDNKAQFVYMLKCVITNFASGWVQIELFQHEITTTNLLMAHHLGSSLKLEAPCALH
jgi:hypothetical protein